MGNLGKTTHLQAPNGCLCSFLSPRVEAPIHDYSRDYVPNMEKYKVVQTFHV